MEMLGWLNKMVSILMLILKMAKNKEKKFVFSKMGIKNMKQTSKMELLMDISAERMKKEIFYSNIKWKMEKKKKNQDGVLDLDSYEDFLKVPVWIFEILSNT